MKYNFIDLQQYQYSANPLINKLLNYHQINQQQINDLNNHRQLEVNNAACIKNVICLLQEIKQKGQKVFICGDYDCDGICATTIMYDCLSRYGIKCGYYIPDRFSDGYGFSEGILAKISNKGYEVIITVDNGVKSINTIEKARTEGYQVIITDHHLIDQKINADALCHPILMDDYYNPMCGAAVAFNIAQALNVATDLNLVLAMIATIGDVMPLWKYNRDLVYQGLKCLNQNRMPVIFDLLKKNTTMVTVEDIAFQIVPKLNSLGRLPEYGNPNNLVKYLLLPSNTKNVALQIESINNKRKNMTAKYLQQALKLVDEQQKFIVLYTDDFHEGLSGLLAGNLANKLHKPIIVFASNQNNLKGSGRTYGDFDIYNHVKKYASQFLETFGGHPMALGCSIKKENLEEFIDVLNSNMPDIFTEVKQDCLVIDQKDITLKNLIEFECLAPFGEGFKQLPFCIENVEVLNHSLIKEKYLKINFTNEITGMCFEKIETTSFSKIQRIIGFLSINEFKNKKSCFINIKKIE